MAGKSSNPVRKKQIETLRRLMMSLPEFCYDFFIGIEPTTTLLTRINYAYDLRTFFEYLQKAVPRFMDKAMSDFTITDLDSLEVSCFEMYLDYLNYYEKGDLERENQDRGKARKLAALRSFFKYFYRKQLLSRDVVSLISTPKIREKAIIRLENDEVEQLLSQVESGSNLTDHQKVYHQYTQLRDLAIMTVFLGTGIRISELTGLNISDVDFKNRSFRIIRKGQKEAIIYFGDEVDSVMREYLEQRSQVDPIPGHEDAFFLSMQRRRISNRSVQDLVKKYAKTAAPLKKITPHKLRSTYGTALYRQTGDIYLVADVLGHTDVNTTRRHYAAIGEAQRKSAANAVVLRENHDAPYDSEE